MSDDSTYVGGASVPLTEIDDIPEPGDTWLFNDTAHIVIKSKVLWPGHAEEPHLKLNLAPKRDVKYWGKWKTEQEVRERARELLDGDADE